MKIRRNILLVATWAAGGALAQTPPATQPSFDVAWRDAASAFQRTESERKALADRVTALTAEVALLRANPPTTRPANRMRIGLNLSEWNEYGTQAQAVNALTTFVGGRTPEGKMLPWGKPDKPWEPSPGLDFTPDGHPLADAAAYSYLYGYPDGVYHFRMEGAGDAAFGGKTRNVAGSFHREEGALVGDVDLRQSRGGVATIRLSGVNPVDPPRNLRLIIPGLPIDTDAVYTPWFLAKLKPIAIAARFMQWGRTNGSTLVEWRDRRRFSEFTQVGDRGVSYEHMIRLANDLNCDVWLCVPHGASDNFVRNMATLFRDGLHADAVVWLEFSNELWNEGGGFTQSQWLKNDAKTNPALLTPGSAAEDAAFQLKRVGDIWRDVFGDQKSRVRPVSGGRQSDVKWAAQGLAYLQTKFGGAQPYVQAVSSSGYFGVAADVDQAGLTADQLFPHLQRMLTGGELKATTAHADLAAEYGLQYVVYEGGQHLVAWNGQLRQPDGALRGGEVNVDLKAAAQADPRMGDLYRALLTQEQTAGTTLFMHFASFEKGGKFGHWGLTESINETGPKLQAVQSFINDHSEGK